MVNTFKCTTLLACLMSAAAFAPLTNSANRRTSLSATKPARLAENVDGVVYVNDKCIDCAACSFFAPKSFVRGKNMHFVYHQPSSESEIQDARAALAACPVAAIRVDNTQNDQELIHNMVMAPHVNGRPKPFPQSLFGIENMYLVGHHNEHSFGGIPYLVQAKHKNRNVWILVDSPRFDASSRKAVTSITGPNGPDYLFLSHVDDTADHQKWQQEYNLQQIFHSGDLGRHNWLNDKSLEHVEVLLKTAPQSSPGLTTYNLDGEILPNNFDGDNTTDVVIYHTPGHSPGSISLYLPRTNTRKDSVLFTGDTLGYTTRDGGRMSAFSRYSNNARTQYTTLQNICQLDFDVIAPGHGHARDFRNHHNRDKKKELQGALDELAGKMSFV